LYLFKGMNIFNINWKTESRREYSKRIYIYRNEKKAEKKR
jgi:hypothetical protein